MGAIRTRPRNTGAPGEERAAWNAAGKCMGKGVFQMMDLFMVGALAASFGLVWLLIRWCQKQLDSPES